MKIYIWAGYEVLNSKFCLLYNLIAIISPEFQIQHTTQKNLTQNSSDPYKSTELSGPYQPIKHMCIHNIIHLVFRRKTLIFLNWFEQYFITKFLKIAP